MARPSSAKSFSIELSKYYQRNYLVEMLLQFLICEIDTELLKTVQQDMMKHMRGVLL